MQNKPLLSIVTSIYNGGDNLKGFLQCISNQTYDNMEVILVDDCSTDEKTKQIIADLEANRLEFKKSFKLIKNERNLGLFKAFQKGLDVASGDYYAFPESDDFLDLDFYEVAMNEIILHKRVDVVKGLMINKYSNRDLIYNDNMSEQERKELRTLAIIDEEVLPISIRNTNGQIISYIMPDITYSWFYVFSKELLLEGYDKPMFENAILYGFSNSVFSMKYREVQVSLDKASFYYYNAHNIFDVGGNIVPVIESNRFDAKNLQLTKLNTDQLLLKKILKRYQSTIDTLKIE